MLSKYTNGSTTVTLQNFLDVVEWLGGFDKAFDEGNGHACFGWTWAVDHSNEDDDSTTFDYTITVDGEIYESVRGVMADTYIEYAGLTPQDVLFLAKKCNMDGFYTEYKGKLYVKEYASTVNDGELLEYITVDGEKIFL